MLILFFEFILFVIIYYNIEVYIECKIIYSGGATYGRHL